MSSLAAHPERAEWQGAPRHLLITQTNENNEQREALLVCKQGDQLAKHHDRKLLDDPAYDIKCRKEKLANPYSLPGHFLAMDVSLDDESTAADEPITYELELRTADMLNVSRNKQGFEVSDLDDTTLISMYVCVSVMGQDILLTALRPRDLSIIEGIDWMTLPEVPGTHNTDRLYVFKTSVQITTAECRTVLEVSRDVAVVTGFTPITIHENSRYLKSSNVLPCVAEKPVSRKQPM